MDNDEADIRGSRPISRLKAQAIRWPKWRAIPHIELWEAVLLSLGTEPTDEQRQLATSNQASVRDARDFRRIRGYAAKRELPTEYWERLSFCLSGLAMAGPIRPQGPLHAGMLKDPACRVLLDEVAALLLMAEFSVPEEMGGLEPVLAATPSHVAAPETPKQRRVRLLAMFDAETLAGREQGALARITEVEKRNRPTADRSYIGKDLKKAREERDAERRGGALTRLLG